MRRVDALKMYGAVLWSDPSSERALIWCEDHADLAFFAAECCSTPRLEAGDLVTFTLTTEKSMRVAQDVEVVATEEYPFLAHGLQLAKTRQDRRSDFVADCVSSSNVLPFVLPERCSAAPSRGSRQTSQAR